ncbi:hypothetical protein SESBI_41286 [Sesbania bispinosa]|nr:hypothetical protein SESBI_41286 [Sesbania bispinosa]
MFRPIPSIVPKWCSSRRDLKTANSKGQETTALPVDFVLKHYKDLSPYLRTCNSLQLSPDFLIPQEMGDEEMTRSTVVDCDEPMSSSSGSSGSENISMACTEIVRKRRSGWTVCAKFMTNRNKVSDEDMATSMS